MWGNSYVTLDNIQFAAPVRVECDPSCVRGAHDITVQFEYATLYSLPTIADDFDGQPRPDPPSMGADEPGPQLSTRAAPARLGPWSHRPRPK